MGFGTDKSCGWNDVLGISVLIRKEESLSSELWTKQEIYSYQERCDKGVFIWGPKSI